MPGEVYIGGHSLGAARGIEYAYSRIMRGLRVDGIYALAPPNPGGAQIGSSLAQVTNFRSIKNGRDIVPDFPVDIAFLGEEYVQPRGFQEIFELPASDDLDPLSRWHHIPLYVAGVSKLPNTGVAVELGEAGELISRLYDDVTGWDWINPIDGDYWAKKVMPSGAQLMIARGSKTLRDWLDDFDAVQTRILGACMSVGFWAGIGPIEGLLDAQLA